MPLVPAKCTQCGSNLEIDSSKEAAICPFCNTPFITEKAINHYNTTNVTNIENLHADVVNILDDNSKENKVLSGDTFIKLGDYAKAESVYIELTENFPHDYRGWWGLIRVKTLDFTNCDISRTIYNELNTLYKKIETVTDTIAPEIESIYSEYIKECGKKLTSFEKNASDEMNTIDGHLDDIDKAEKKEIEIASDKYEKTKSVLENNIKIYENKNKVMEKISGTILGILIVAFIIIEIIFFSEANGEFDMIIVALLGGPLIMGGIGCAIYFAINFLIILPIISSNSKKVKMANEQLQELKENYRCERTDIENKHREEREQFNIQKKDLSDVIKKYE